MRKWGMNLRHLIPFALFPASLFACLNTYEIDGHAELESMMAKLDFKRAAAPPLTVEEILGPEIDQIKITGTLAGDSVTIPIHMAEAHNHSSAMAEVNEMLETDYRARTNQAVLKIRSHQYLGAIKILHSVEHEVPGLYATATNLGTAYELAGEVEKAHQWIATGIERNPKAHNGTEWVHLAILDAKLELKNNPDWLENNDVIDVKDTKRSADEVITAVEYQLEERLVFVKAPDPTVSSLFKTLGELYESKGSEKAEEYQKRATEFSAEEKA